jgi:protein-disulfide isomerase
MNRREEKLVEERTTAHVSHPPHHPAPSIISVPASIIIGSTIIALSILLSGGVLEVKGLTGKKMGTTATASTAPAASSVPAAAAPDTGPVKVSIDDDAVLGDKNAPLTMVEFSDYECPFCKRYFDQTYPELKKNYIDTGKLKVVFRDLPLTFHDPMATKEAVAANCAKEQGGDAAYYKMHDAMFTQTTSNGTGLSVDKLYTIAGEIGMNAANFKTCLDSDKYKDEVKKDLADAGTAGADGTPTFFVGKSDPSGTIEGTRLVGAQPYTAFSTIIDGLLK